MPDSLTSMDYELIADALAILSPDGATESARADELEAWARSMARPANPESGE